MPLSNLDDNPSDSSADENLDAQQDQNLDTEEQSGAAAESSTAEGDKPESTLDIVQDVVAKTRQTETASPAEGDESGTDKGTEDQPKSGDEEDFSDVPFNKHPRFQQLIRQRDTYKAGHVQFQKVNAFLEQNDISPQQADEAFAILALMRKGDAAGAWELLKPHVQQVLIAAGEVLPDDLRQRVANGELTPEIAAEVAKERAKAKSVESGRTFDQQRQEREQNRQRVGAVETAARDWQADRAKKDPNFAAKLPLLQREVAFLIQTEGRPDTPEGVKDQLDRAYKEVAGKAVSTTAARPGPKPPKVGDGPQRPRPTAANGASGNQAQAPADDTLSIIRQRVARRAG